MRNCIEFQKIKKSKLPSPWQSDYALEKLESFLQANWKERAVFYTDGVITSSQQFIDFDVRDGIKTQNYIGTICFEGGTLNIFPKTYKLDADDDEYEDWDTEDLVHNLVVWLNYCDKYEFPFINITSSLSNTNNLFELLVAIYSHYVKQALDRAPFRQYEDVYEIGEVVKGRIDFTSYIGKQYPNGNWNKIPYEYSNFVFDNKVNRILKSTCKLLYGLTSERKSKDLLRNLMVRLGEVADENVLPADCDKIRLSKLHSKYSMLLSMSKMFLLNRTSTNDVGTSKSFCFLFPTELLFEGFIGGYLKEKMAEFAKVRCQTSDQYLANLLVDGEYKGRAFRLKEDIMVETEDAVIVLDTKYKEIDRFDKINNFADKLGISDNDMKQMAVYAVKRKAKKLFLIYPLYRDEDMDKREVIYDIMFDDADPTKHIPLEVLRVPFVGGLEDQEVDARMDKLIKKIMA